MNGHQILYFDEVKRGNYVVFVNHVLEQIPVAYRVGAVDIEVLNKYRDELLGIADELGETYCTAMSTTNTDFFKGGNCVEFVKQYWRDFITGIDRNEHWVSMVMYMLKLFSANVGVTALVTLPIQLSSLAVSIISGENKPVTQLVSALGKLSALTTAFYAEALVHLLTENVGVPLSAYMMLAGGLVNELLKVYGNVIA
ncbi:hypothetical protein [Vulcanisaeta souniana]|uniref:Uncharacterized protein n=1 Tax=Vulcanisaeta souniana JCM 11219 TaxID=1293586 RepID=A0A830E835_9CREN|nr:hypothetical protein [Vulcanisaeta souniana]BDR93285.1 hypothetical protein Vsou_23780 [Vulcanisaeta souniana JCM 11219]GGI78957.1 hypothetical protein GCM10007112_14850 [Vulcanisaeta souniana JCM 11219]